MEKEKGLGIQRVARTWFGDVSATTSLSFKAMQGASKAGSLGVMGDPPEHATDQLSST